MKKIILMFSAIFFSFQMNAQDLISGGANSWILHTPDDGKTTMHLTSKLNGSWQWAKETIFYNNGNVKINGNLGIKTTNPQAALDVNGSAKIRGSLTINSTDFVLGANSGRDKGVKVHQRALVHSINDELRINYGGDFEGGVKIQGPKTIIDGYVGIGTSTTGSHKLAVEGSIGAREVKVEATGWSDFVFYEDYNLPTLKEVAKHIKERGHLKDIPSAKEVKENGIFLGAMDAKLLQKIEELTLYTLQQEKKLVNQEKEILALKAQFKQLEKWIQKN